MWLKPLDLSWPQTIRSAQLICLIVESSAIFTFSTEAIHATKKSIIASQKSGCWYTVAEFSPAWGALRLPNPLRFHQTKIWLTSPNPHKSWRKRCPVVWHTVMFWYYFHHTGLLCIIFMDCEEYSITTVTNKKMTVWVWSFSTTLRYVNIFSVRVGEHAEVWCSLSF